MDMTICYYGGMRVSDKRWATLQKKIEEYSGTSNYFGLGTTYYEMAWAVQDDPEHYKQLRDLGYKFKLANMISRLHAYSSSDAIYKVEVFANKDACEACMQINGYTKPPDYELKYNSLPVAKCTNKYGCRCTYLTTL